MKSCNQNRVEHLMQNAEGVGNYTDKRFQVDRPSPQTQDDDNHKEFTKNRQLIFTIPV